VAQNNTSVFCKHESSGQYLHAQEGHELTEAKGISKGTSEVERATQMKNGLTTYTYA